MARIAGVDLPREKRVEVALTYIYGIGPNIADDIIAATGVNPDTRVKDLTEEDISKLRDYTRQDSPYLYDMECFDFNKWKKCAAKVLNQYSHLLLFESDPQGEAALRFEIAKYLYRSRSVSAHPKQIVVGAGTQQITSHLSRILQKMKIQRKNSPAILLNESGSSLKQKCVPRIVTSAPSRTPSLRILPI